MNFSTLTFFLSLAFALAVTTGCKDKEETASESPKSEESEAAEESENAESVMSRACENIAKLMEEGEDYAKEGGECSKDMDQVREACSNFDEVVQCAADASDEDALKNCQRETCKRNED